MACDIEKPCIQDDYKINPNPKNDGLPGIQADFYRVLASGGRWGCSGTKEVKPVFNTVMTDGSFASRGAA